jgi:hypothetical protein
MRLLVLAAIIPTFLTAQDRDAAGALGVVVDSIHGGSLANATILVEGTRLTTTSNAVGEFRFDSIPIGTRRFLLRHPVVDSIGVDIVSSPIELTPGRVALVALAVPSPGTLRRVFCSPRDTLLGTTMVRGRIADPDTDIAIAGAKVSLLYSVLAISKETGVKRLPRLREATTSKDGTYAICGLPADFAGTLMAEKDSVTTPEVPIRPGMTEIVFRDLTLAGSVVATAATPMPAAATTDSARLPAVTPSASRARVGRAVIEGRVVGVDHVGIAGAQVAVAGTTQNTVTSGEGTFTIGNLPSGTSVILARKIGFGPASAIVDLTTRQPRDVTLTLTKATPTLEAVTVVAPMEARLRRVGFAERRRMGLGRYMDAQEIERRHPVNVTDIIHFFPGFRIVQSEFGATIVPTRSVAGQATSCVNLFVDHALWNLSQPGDLDRAVNANEIAAVETYAGDYVPQEFAVPTKTCATIVIWRKARLDEK